MLVPRDRKYDRNRANHPAFHRTFLISDSHLSQRPTIFWTTITHVHVPYRGAWSARLRIIYTRLLKRAIFFTALLHTYDPLSSESSSMCKRIIFRFVPRRVRRWSSLDNPAAEKNRGDMDFATISRFYESTWFHGVVDVNGHRHPGHLALQP